jgi:hypothetical protein
MLLDISRKQRLYLLLTMGMRHAEEVDWSISIQVLMLGVALDNARCCSCGNHTTVNLKVFVVRLAVCNEFGCPGAGTEKYGRGFHLVTVNQSDANAGSFIVEQ